MLLAGFAMGTSEYGMGGSSPGMYSPLSMHSTLRLYTSRISVVTPFSIRYPVTTRRFEHFDANYTSVDCALSTSSLP